MNAAQEHEAQAKTAAAEAQDYAAQAGRLAKQSKQHNDRGNHKPTDENGRDNGLTAAADALWNAERADEAAGAARYHAYKEAQTHTKHKAWHHDIDEKTHRAKEKAAQARRAAEHELQRARAGSNEQ
jgi:hypothetical protein